MMAGTWLDIDPRREPYSCCGKRWSERENGGGRHWTRTSDLLHVKQVRGRSRASLSAARNRKPAPATLHGWTLAGLLGVLLSLATITVACVLLLGDPISILVWPGVGWVVGEMLW